MLHGAAGHCCALAGRLCVLAGTLLLWPSGVRDGITSCDRIEGFNPKEPNEGLYRGASKASKVGAFLIKGRALVEVSARG